MTGLEVDYLARWELQLRWEATLALLHQWSGPPVLDAPGVTHWLDDRVARHRRPGDRPYVRICAGGSARAVRHRWPQQAAARCKAACHHRDLAFRTALTTTPSDTLGRRLAWRLLASRFPVTEADRCIGAYNIMCAQSPAPAALGGSPLLTGPQRCRLQLLHLVKLVQAAAFCHPSAAAPSAVYSFVGALLYVQSGSSLAHDLSPSLPAHVPNCAGSAARPAVVAAFLPSGLTEPGSRATVCASQRPHQSQEACDQYFTSQHRQRQRPGDGCTDAWKMIRDSPSRQRQRAAPPPPSALASSAPVPPPSPPLPSLPVPAPASLPTADLPSSSVAVTAVPHELPLPALAVTPPAGISGPSQFPAPWSPTAYPSYTVSPLGSRRLSVAQALAAAERDSGGVVTTDLTAAARAALVSQLFALYQDPPSSEPAPGPVPRPAIPSPSPAPLAATVARVAFEVMSRALDPTVIHSLSSLPVGQPQPGGQDFFPLLCPLTTHPLLAPTLPPLLQPTAAVPPACPAAPGGSSREAPVALGDLQMYIPGVGHFALGDAVVRELHAVGQALLMSSLADVLRSSPLAGLSVCPGPVPDQHQSPFLPPFLPPPPSLAASSPWCPLCSGFDLPPPPHLFPAADAPPLHPRLRAPLSYPAPSSFEPDLPPCLWHHRHPELPPRLLHRRHPELPPHLLHHLQPDLPPHLLHQRDRIRRLVPPDHLPRRPIHRHQPPPTCRPADYRRRRSRSPSPDSRDPVPGAPKRPRTGYTDRGPVMPARGAVPSPSSHHHHRRHRSHLSGSLFPGAAGLEGCMPTHSTRHRHQQKPSATATARPQSQLEIQLQLLAGGVEPNPGPSGILNAMADAPVGEATAWLMAHYPDQQTPVPDATTDGYFTTTSFLPSSLGQVLPSPLSWSSTPLGVHPEMLIPEAAINTFEAAAATHYSQSNLVSLHSSPDDPASSPPSSPSSPSSLSPPPYLTDEPGSSASDTIMLITPDSPSPPSPSQSSPISSTVTPEAEINTTVVTTEAPPPDNHCEAQPDLLPSPSSDTSQPLSELPPPPTPTDPSTISPEPYLPPRTPLTEPYLRNEPEAIFSTHPGHTSQPLPHHTYTKHDWGFTLGHSQMFTPEQWQRFVNMIERYKAAFAMSMADLAKGYQGDHPPMKINISDPERPCKTHHRWHTPMERAIIRDKLQPLVELGIVVPSPSSNFACNLLLPPKKDADGNWTDRRLCTDYRAINTRAELIPHRPPRIEELFMRALTPASALTPPTTSSTLSSPQPATLSQPSPSASSPAAPPVAAGLPAASALSNPASHSNPSTSSTSSSSPSTLSSSPSSSSPSTSSPNSPVLPPLPAGTKVYTRIDMRSGFLQLWVDEAHAERTGFYYENTIMCYRRVPFGLKSSPCYYQMVMDYELRKAGLDHCCMAYIDDVLTHSESAEEHIQHVEQLLQHLIRVNLLIHPEKSIFGTDVVEYLGHNVSSAYGVTPHAARVAAIQALPEPTNVTELRHALGFINYYRCYIPNASAIASPLHRLLQKDVTWTWTEEHRAAFQHLKDEVSHNGRAIRPPDYSKPLILYTDFSQQGIAAVLAQPDGEGSEYMVACISRSLNKHERNYASYKGEMLAAVWAVKTLDPYLRAHPFTLVTDHQPLQYLLTNTDLTGQYARWALVLQEYNVTIQHRKGKLHQNVDVPSRHPRPDSDDFSGARAAGPAAAPSPSSSAPASPSPSSSSPPTTSHSPTSTIHHASATIATTSLACHRRVRFSTSSTHLYDTVSLPHVHHHRGLPPPMRSCLRRPADPLLAGFASSPPLPLNPVSAQSVNSYPSPPSSLDMAVSIASLQVIRYLQRQSPPSPASSLITTGADIMDISVEPSEPEGLSPPELFSHEAAAQHRHWLRQRATRWVAAARHLLRRHRPPRSLALRVLNPASPSFYASITTAVLPTTQLSAMLRQGVTL